MNKTDKIYVAGHRGLVGSAIVRKLQEKGYTNIITRTSQELNLTSQQAVNDFFATEKPDYVFLSAAKVGGIHANNTFRADFIYQNLMIEANLIHGAHLAGVSRLCFLGSSCIYPRDCPQPIREDYLLTGPLEQTNEPYALAKIAGIKLCESYNRQYGRQYFSAMPTNLYGPNDNYDLANSHVLPALIRKAHEAGERGDGELVVWGSGTPRREFLYVDDLADACVFLMQQGVTDGIYNIGAGEDVTIRELAEMITSLAPTEVTYGAARPGDVASATVSSALARAEFGWSARMDFLAGLRELVDEVGALAIGDATKERPPAHAREPAPNVVLENDDDEEQEGPDEVVENPRQRPELQELGGKERDPDERQTHEDLLGSGAANEQQDPIDEVADDEDVGERRDDLEDSTVRQKAEIHGPSASSIRDRESQQTMSRRRCRERARVGRDRMSDGPAQGRGELAPIAALEDRVGPSLEAVR